MEGSDLGDPKTFCSAAFEQCYALEPNTNHDSSDSDSKDSSEIIAHDHPSRSTAIHTVERFVSGNTLLNHCPVTVQALSRGELKKDDLPPATELLPESEFLHGCIAFITEKISYREDLKQDALKNPTKYSASGGRDLAIIKWEQENGVANIEEDGYALWDACENSVRMVMPEMAKVCKDHNDSDNDGGSEKEVAKPSHCMYDIPAIDLQAIVDIPECEAVKHFVSDEKWHEYHDYEMKKAESSAKKILIQMVKKGELKMLNKNISNRYLEHSNDEPEKKDEEEKPEKDEEKPEKEEEKADEKDKKKDDEKKDEEKPEKDEKKPKKEEKKPKKEHHEPKKTESKPHPVKESHDLKFEDPLPASEVTFYDDPSTTPPSNDIKASDAVTYTPEELKKEEAEWQPHFDKVYIFRDAWINNMVKTLTMESESHETETHDGWLEFGEDECGACHDQCHKKTYDCHYDTDHSQSCLQCQDCTNSLYKTLTFQACESPFGVNDADCFAKCDRSNDCETCSTLHSSCGATVGLDGCIASCDVEKCGMKDFSKSNSSVNVTQEVVVPGSVGSVGSESHSEEHHMMFSQYNSATSLFRKKRNLLSNFSNNKDLSNSDSDKRKNRSRFWRNQALMKISKISETSKYKDAIKSLSKFKKVVRFNFKNRSLNLNDPKAEPKSEPKAEPKPEPKAEPKPEHKADPKPEPKADPKHTPKPKAKSKSKPHPKHPPPPKEAPESESEDHDHDHDHDDHHEEPNDSESDDTHDVQVPPPPPEPPVIPTYNESNIPAQPDAIIASDSGFLDPGWDTTCPIPFSCYECIKGDELHALCKEECSSSTCHHPTKECKMCAYGSEEEHTCRSLCFTKEMQGKEREDPDKIRPEIAKILTENPCGRQASKMIQSCYKRADDKGSVHTCDDDSGLIDRACALREAKEKMKVNIVKESGKKVEQYAEEMKDDDDSESSTGPTLPLDADPEAEVSESSDHPDETPHPASHSPPESPNDPDILTEEGQVNPENASAEDLAGLKHQEEMVEKEMEEVTGENDEVSTGAGTDSEEEHHEEGSF